MPQPPRPEAARVVQASLSGWAPRRSTRWCRFIEAEGGEAGAETARQGAFKIIPRVAEGSWVVKQAVGQNTPVLLGRKLTTKYFRRVAAACTLPACLVGLRRRPAHGACWHAKHVCTVFPWCSARLSCDGGPCSLASAACCTIHMEGLVLGVVHAAACSGEQPLSTGGSGPCLAGQPAAAACSRVC